MTGGSLGDIPNWRSHAVRQPASVPLPADWIPSMSDTPTPPENPDEPQPVSSGDPLVGPEPPRDDPPTAPTQPMAAGPQPRRLTRSSSDKVLGGVAGGLGRYFDIDPIIFRIGFVVLTLAGGAGVLGYLAAWVLVPPDPVAGAGARRPQPRRHDRRALPCSRSPRACCSVQACSSSRRR